MVAFDVNLVEVLSYTVFGKREGKKDGLVRNEYGEVVAPLVL